MPEANQIPKKRQFKTNEVCQLTDTQPYVLRFWESEFPQLNPDRRGGQPVYRRKDIDVVLRIKQLLYDEEYTIEGARRRLQQELNGEVEPTAPATAEAVDDEPEPADEPADDGPLFAVAEREFDTTGVDADAVARERYEDAIDEIRHLRLKLQEAEATARKLESRARKHQEQAEAYRERMELTAGRLERLIDRLD